MSIPADPRSDVCSGILKRYSRAVVHLQQRLKSDHLGLIFGAGIGKPFGFPDWEELLNRLANVPEVDGSDIVSRTSNLTARAQRLFQKYKNRFFATLPHEEKLDVYALEMRLRAGWRKLVHSAIYQDVPDTDEQLLAKDEYLLSFARVIRRSLLTVTYNFDDTLERILSSARTPDEQSTRGYTTIWSGNVQLHSKRGVVYHPNGFLPRRLRDRPSDQLVLLEDSFADQLIDSMSGHYASLSVHMAQTTCLFVGLSLSDPTLKHLLRQSAKLHPGHYHYLISFVRDPSTESAEHQSLEAAANFDVYNLITLHLTAAEINGLATLIALDEHDLHALATEYVDKACFRFFVTGSVSVGKSTLVSNMRALLTQDEWTEERAPGMEKAPDLLTPEQTAAIDHWVADQVSKKNINLAKYKTGIHVIDRAPLDAFAFTPTDKWKEKAAFIRAAVSPGMAADRKLLGGHVVLLIGNPNVMAARAMSLHKETTREKLDTQQKLLMNVYARMGYGVSVIDTTGKTPFHVAKEFASIIFAEPYSEADLDRRLTEFAGSGYEI